MRYGILIMVVLMALFSASALSISEELQQEKKMKASPIESFNATAANINNLRVLKQKILQEPNPEKRDELRQQLKKEVATALEVGRERTLRIQEEKKALDDLIRKNIRLGIDREKLEKSSEYIDELKSRIKELNQADTEEKKAELIEEVEELKGRIEKKLPEIKERVVRKHEDLRAKKDNIEIIAKKVRDKSKQKVLERMQQKDMVKFDKLRKIVDITDRETMKKAKKTLVTLSLKAERKMYGVDIVEEIPKSYADDISNVGFSVEPDEILEDDPIVKWSFETVEEGEEAHVSYWVDGEHEENTTTIAAEEPFRSKKLGQLITFVVLACIVFIVLALYIVGRKKEKL